MNDTDSEMILILYELLGARPLTSNHLILQTYLNKDELCTLWLGIGNELIIANQIKGLHQYPATKTSFGLRVGTNIILDLVAKKSTWNAEDSLVGKTIPCPSIILAGLPASGKSTVARELRRLTKTYSGETTITTRSERTEDVDFDSRLLTNVSDDLLLISRKSPAYAFPVVFRGKEYISKVAGMIERFTPSTHFMLFIDSHYMRVAWRKRLMPDIKIVWLDTENSTLKKRLQSRLTENNRVTKEYIDSCYKTKLISDIVISTEAIMPDEIAKRILKWIDIPIEL